MQLPPILARPAFQFFYPRLRKRLGSPIPPTKRKITLPEPARREAFDSLVDDILAGSPGVEIRYGLPYPKPEFLAYVCDWGGLVLHGSPRKDLQTLEPIRLSGDNNEFGNRQQIFASPDAFWAMWFAILDKTKFNWTRNGCLRQGRGPGRLKYYHFELPLNNRENNPFADGMIYFCRAEDFPDKRPDRLLDWFDAEVEEWGSTKPVAPLARMAVTPQDFPYLNMVQFC